MDAGAFTEPSASKEALEQYRSDSDPIIAFTEECLRKVSGMTTLLKEVYPKHVSWTKESGFEPLGRNNFRKGLERAVGITARKTDEGVGFEGLTIQP